jgi:hypothetical protein
MMQTLRGIVTSTSLLACHPWCQSLASSKLIAMLFLSLRSDVRPLSSISRIINICKSQKRSNCWSEGVKRRDALLNLLSTDHKMGAATHNRRWEIKVQGSKVRQVLSIGTTTHLDSRYPPGVQNLNIQPRLKWKWIISFNVSASRGRWSTLVSALSC